MKWLKTFNNPFVLGAQGFLAGAALFFVTHPGAAEDAKERGGAIAEQAMPEGLRSRA